MLTSPASPLAENETSSPEAYALVRPELDAVDESELAHINVDIAAAVTTVLASLPRLRELRQAMIDTVNDFDVQQFDKLEIYARAAYQGHSLWTISHRPVEPLPLLVKEGTELRNLLHSDARALVTRGLLDASQLRKVRTGNGHQALCRDLTGLAHVLKTSWTQIEGKTGVSPEDVERAHRLSDRILTAVAHKGVARGQAHRQASLLRKRAYTLFFRAYDNARRALWCVRWHEGDMEHYLPSLYKGRTAGPRKLRPQPTDSPIERVSVTVAASAPTILPATPHALRSENPPEPT